MKILLKSDLKNKRIVHKIFSKLTLKDQVFDFILYPKVISGFDNTWTDLSKNLLDL